MIRYVYDFAEGGMDQKDLLGGKGANLAEMTRLGLPVPPGFTITTDACRAYLEVGRAPDGMAEEIDTHLTKVEAARGRTLGDPDDPLLVSVRSGAKFSMPGMMETVLNVGLNDESVKGLAKVTGGDERFAYDSYPRLLQMFGSTVLGIEIDVFHDALDALKAERGTRDDLDLTALDMQGLVETYKTLITEHGGRGFPQDPREQLDMAVGAVFESWNTERAEIYRRQEHIPHDLGTAVNVCTMVFGNGGADSGTGVAFTRDPATGAQGIYGDYLENAQGEDVVAGIRNTVPLADLEHIDKAAYDQLIQIMARLEGHYRDLCDIEFTVEHGTLWMLQTRVGKRTAEAAFRIASSLVDQELIDLDEAVNRVNGAQLAQLMFPRFDTDAERHLIGSGMNASPGAAVGKAVFDSPTAVEWAARGDDVILVRRTTTPDDLAGMVAAKGILTSRGGKTSHAAVVARGMGRTCVCGADKLEVDIHDRRFTSADGTVIAEGDVISIDGTTGEVFAGSVPVVDSAVMRHFEGDEAAAGDEPVIAAARLMEPADSQRRLQVRANADTPQ
ncbi:pyruvate, phosphate dikinase, partial [Aeromicrobium sp.]|uniref:pyruvate, phosphate dikinase n=1 Tax=Aeromicrobium sp. TaxID=1871063 RepID=UPI001995A7AD